jgi:hypothetical protein
MANLSQTAANVKLKNTGPVATMVAGETLTQGQPFYTHTDGTGWRCDNNDGAAKAAASGIVLTPALVGETFVYALPGAHIDLGATLTVGETYCVSATVGAICPIGDLVSTNFVTMLGIATAASTLPFRPVVSGVAKP